MSIQKILKERIISKHNLAKDLDPLEGLVLLVDKPKDWTSFDVVNKIRFALKHSLKVKKIKVGHAGTLDPLATGLLLICVGKYTKLIDELASMSKTYEAGVKFGAVTASYDAECEEEDIKTDLPQSSQEIESVLPLYTGDIMQMPPIYSAIKIDGKAAYKMARAGKDVEMKQRPVTIHSYKILNYDKPFATFFIDCSKGTYIRSLAHDLGQTLGCGAYLTRLVRTSIDDYQLVNALSLDEILEFIGK